MPDACTKRGCTCQRLVGLLTCVECADPGAIVMLVESLRARVDFEAEAEFDRRAQAHADAIMRKLLAGQEDLF